MDASLRQSPLHDAHIASGARMVPFAGWQMPVQYEGIIPENQAVRSGLGVFDISHMGQVFVEGSETHSAATWLDQLLTNHLESLHDGQGQYTLLLNESGGVIDDLIVYRQRENAYFLVVNASKTEEDVAWMTARLPADGITLTDSSSAWAAMAVQGPDTPRAFTTLFGTDAELPQRFCMTSIATADGNVIVCRTGYTGEDGFELFCSANTGLTWWQRCLDAGARPCGLGARDSLRLEKCYPLNGNDLAPDRTPLEAGLGFAVDLTKPAFTGRDILLAQKADGLQRKLVALRQTGKSPPPRAGYRVLVGDEEIGVLTSGGMSPGLGCGISMGYIAVGHHTIGTQLDVEIRGKRFPAEVVRKPFL